MRRILPFFLIAPLILISLWQMSLLRQHGRVHNNDFKHVWIGTRVLAEGGNPYDEQQLFKVAQREQLGSINPFVYLPTTGVLLFPIGLMKFKTAEVFWFWFNWLLAWGTILAAPLLLGRVREAWIIYLAGGLFVIGSLPFLRQMTAGQMNVVLLATIVGAIGLARADREIFTGILIGLAAAFKISPLFLVFCLMLMMRKRAMFSAKIAFSLTCFTSLFWHGPRVFIGGIEMMLQMGYGRSTWSHYGMDFYRQPTNQSINSLLHHLLTDNPHTQAMAALSPTLVNLLTALISLVMIAMLGGCAWRYHKQGLKSAIWNDNETQTLMIGSLLMLLIPSLMWDHYAIQALPALFWLVSDERVRRSWLLAPLMIGAFACLSIPIAHSASIYRTGFHILLMSLRLWGVLALLIALMATTFMRRSESTS